MSCHSKYGYENSPDYHRLLWLNHNAYVSSDGPEWMTRAVCDNCVKSFETMLEDAKVRVVSGLPLLCLECDNEAGKSTCITGFLAPVWFAV